MATLLTTRQQWHSGEDTVQRLLLNSPQGDNPTSAGLPERHGYRVMQSPLVAFGTLDREGRPWTTIWGGETGFCRPISRNVLGARITADMRFDPVFQELFAVEEAEERKIKQDEVVHPQGGMVMSGLSIDLETRDRVKLAGRFIAGSVTKIEAGVADGQLAYSVEETLGNCPKYLNKKKIVPHTPKPKLMSKGKGLPLSDEAVDLIHQADLFFISSRHGNSSAQSMDTNHRGGPKGFVRVFRNDATEGVTIVYPEYSGNKLYQTLGNLQEDPVAGLVLPNFENGDVLYLTGSTTILVGENAASYMPRTKLAIKIDVAEARLVKDGLPFRGSIIDYSPYNPPVRPLANEQLPLGSEAASSAAIATLTLQDRQAITPSISRFTFKLRPITESAGADVKLAAWHPGQHITLDFSPELDHGWSHMRDDDPQSLNDDFIRTFTISTPLDPSAVDEHGNLKRGISPEVEITARKHGPATSLLWRWNPRAPLEIPVLAFGGSEEFRIPTSTSGKQSIFVAGGVGITPLMAQAQAVLEARGNSDSALRLLWSLRAADLDLANFVLKRYQGLSKTTDLYVTGQADLKAETKISELEKMGSRVTLGRITKENILSAGEHGRRKYYCCTGPGLMKNLRVWTDGEDVEAESFEY